MYSSGGDSSHLNRKSSSERLNYGSGGPGYARRRSGSGIDLNRRLIGGDRLNADDSPLKNRSAFGKVTIGEKPSLDRPIERNISTSTTSVLNRPASPGRAGFIRPPSPGRRVSMMDQAGERRPFTRGDSPMLGRGGLAATSGIAGGGVAGGIGSSGIGVRPPSPGIQRSNSFGRLSSAARGGVGSAGDRLNLSLSANTNANNSLNSSLWSSSDQRNDQSFSAGINSSGMREQQPPRRAIDRLDAIQSARRQSSERKHPPSASSFITPSLGSTRVPSTGAGASRLRSSSSSRQLTFSAGTAPPMPPRRNSESKSFLSSSESSSRIPLRPPSPALRSSILAQDRNPSPAKQFLFRKSSAERNFDKSVGIVDTPGYGGGDVRGGLNRTTSFDDRAAQRERERREDEQRFQELREREQHQRDREHQLREQERREREHQQQLEQQNLNYQQNRQDRFYGNNSNGVGVDDQPRGYNGRPVGSGSGQRQDQHVLSGRFGAGNYANRDGFGPNQYSQGQQQQGAVGYNGRPAASHVRPPTPPGGRGLGGNQGPQNGDLMHSRDHNQPYNYRNTLNPQQHPRQPLLRPRQPYPNNQQNNKKKPSKIPLLDSFCNLLGFVNSSLFTFSKNAFVVWCLIIAVVLGCGDTMILKFEDGFVSILDQLAARYVHSLGTVQAENWRTNSYGSSSSSSVDAENSLDPTSGNSTTSASTEGKARRDSRVDVDAAFPERVYRLQPLADWIREGRELVLERLGGDDSVEVGEDYSDVTRKEEKVEETQEIKPAPVRSHQRAVPDTPISEIVPKVENISPSDDNKKKDNYYRTKTSYVDTVTKSETVTIPLPTSQKDVKENQKTPATPKKTETKTPVTEETATWITTSPPSTSTATETTPDATNTNTGASANQLGSNPATDPLPPPAIEEDIVFRPGGGPLTGLTKDGVEEEQQKVEEKAKVAEEDKVMLEKSEGSVVDEGKSGGSSKSKEQKIDLNDAGTILGETFRGIPLR